MKTDIRESDDTNAFEIMSVKNKLKDIHKLDKRVSKLENKIQDNKTVAGSANSADKGAVCSDQNMHCAFSSENSANESDIPKILE